MQQFTASEAHKLALTALSDEYDKVVSMIKEEAEKGKNTIKIDNMNPTIQKELQNNGFNVIQDEYLHGRNTISQTILYW